MSVLIPAIGRSLGPAIRSVFSLSDAAPTYYWDFRPGRLDANMSFTRASSGWYFNSADVLTSASSSVARFDYDPVTLQPLGYLAEMQSTNAVTNSNNLAATTWGAGTAVTRTANALVSPDGTSNATSIIEDTTNARHECDEVAELSATLNSVYGVSLFFKNVSGTRHLVVSMGGGSSWVGVNPATGVLDPIGGTAFSQVSVRSIGSGWYRLQAQWTAPATGATALYLSLQTGAPAGSTQIYLGDGASGVSVWGVQWETAGVGVTSYIPTAGSAVTRSQDILSLPLTSLPGWNASKGGVLVATHRLHTLAPAVQQRVLEIDDGNSTRNSIFSNGYNSSSGKQGLNTYSGSVAQINIDTGSFNTLFTRTKLASGWSATRGVQAADGAILPGAVNGLFALPAGTTTLNIGGSPGGQQLNGTIESIAYYAGARADAFVQAVSR